MPALGNSSDDEETRALYTSVQRVKILCVFWENPRRFLKYFFMPTAAWAK
jgi:hypothetical protein